MFGGGGGGASEADATSSASLREWSHGEASRPSRTSCLVMTTPFRSLCTTSLRLADNHERQTASVIRRSSRSIIATNFAGALLRSRFLPSQNNDHQASFSFSLATRSSCCLDLDAGRAKVYLGAYTFFRNGIFNSIRLTDSYAMLKQPCTTHSYRMQGARTSYLHGIALDRHVGYMPMLDL